MSDVMQIKGNVKHQITIDPSIWIFDDRKKRLNEFFDSQAQTDKEKDYVEEMSKRWERGLKEGAVPTTKSEEMFVHKKDISGDWGVVFSPFLENAGLKEGATKVVCHLQQGAPMELPLEKVKNSILCFAKDGHPIREDGPVHLIFADGSNREDPVRGITEFEVI